MESAAFFRPIPAVARPPDGNMISWDWFRWYDPSELTIDEIVISWDTAMKATELSDYSVGSVWGVRDLVRVRLDFPALKRKVIEVYERWA
jgi:phage terminase large subunit-like protein